MRGRGGKQGREGEQERVPGQALTERRLLIRFRDHHTSPRRAAQGWPRACRVEQQSRGVEEGQRQQGGGERQRGEMTETHRDEDSDTETDGHSDRNGDRDTQRDIGRDTERKWWGAEEREKTKVEGREGKTET